MWFSLFYRRHMIPHGNMVFSKIYVTWACKGTCPFLLVTFCLIEPSKLIQEQFCPIEHFIRRKAFHKVLSFQPLYSVLKSMILWSKWTMVLNDHSILCGWLCCYVQIPHYRCYPKEITTYYWEGWWSGQFCPEKKKLYRFLVRSKLFYGCMIYGPAAKTSLAQLDPVHNQSASAV